MPLPAIAAGAAAAVTIGKFVAGAATFIEKVTPKLEDEVTVEVLGQPGSSKKTLYFLALQTAYGLARPGLISRFFTPAPSLLMIEYDAAADWVRVTLKYKVGALDFVNQALGTAAFLGPFAGPAAAAQLIGALELVKNMPLLAGPRSYVEGVTPAIPFSFLSVPLPTEDANKFTGVNILTTGENWFNGGQVMPTPNPKPTGDYRSRGSMGENDGGGPGQLPGQGSPVKKLIPLIFAALSAPGSQNDLTFTQPVQTPSGG